MRKPKYTLSERQFNALRETLGQRRINRFLDDNVEAAYAVMVKNLSVRVVAASLGKSVANMNRVVRELWCVANGISKWDLYLHPIGHTVAKAPARNRDAPQELTVRPPTTGRDVGASSGAVLWPRPERPPAIRRVRSAPGTDGHECRKPSGWHFTEMRCICRCFKARGRGYGWQVSLQRTSAGHKHRFIHFFADTEHGGESSSLAAAKAWRNRIECEHPDSRLMRRLGMPAPLGVYRTSYREKTRNGETKLRVNWQAHAPRSVVPARHRSFSVSKYGEEGALRRAIEARKEFEALL